MISIQSKKITIVYTCQINANIEDVWRTLICFKEYENWNPFVVKIETRGKLKVNQLLKLHVKWDNDKKTISPEKVSCFKLPSGLVGERVAVLDYVYEGFLSKIGLVQGGRHQEIAEKDGYLIYTSSETFSGILNKYLPLTRVEDGFKRQALALKKICEKN